MNKEKYFYAKDLTPDYIGFSNLWVYIGAHQETYGVPPNYTKTVKYLQNGGFMSNGQKTTI